MENILKKLTELYKMQKYDDILELIHSIKQHKDIIVNPQLYVMEGMCIQLSDNPKYELQDAKKSFLSALKIDSESETALTELAYYYYNVEDNYEKALPFFLKALLINENKYKEIIKGIEDIHSETDIPQQEFVKDIPRANLERNYFEDKKFRDLIIKHFNFKQNIVKRK